MESNFLNTVTPTQTHERTVYRVRNARTAGFIPSWDAPKDAPVKGSGEVLSSYAPLPETSALPLVTPDAVAQGDAFSFWDLLDMVNPLQHIPVVNLAYRAITGDEIKPVSKVIGGGVFGGPVGLAGGLVNVIVEAETGRDVLGNAVAFVGLGGDLPEKAEPYSFDAEYAAYEDLPAALLSFALKPVADMEIVDADEARIIKRKDYARVQIASGRTAGTIAIYS